MNECVKHTNFHTKLVCSQRQLRTHIQPAYVTQRERERERERERIQNTEILLSMNNIEICLTTAFCVSVKPAALLLFFRARRQEAETV